MVYFDLREKKNSVRGKEVIDHLDKVNNEAWFETVELRIKSDREVKEIQNDIG